jgi:hypothetical protein
MNDKQEKTGNNTPPVLVDVYGRTAPKAAQFAAARAAGFLRRDAQALP